MEKIKPLLFSVCTGILLSFPWLIRGMSWTLFFAFVPLLLAEDLSQKNSFPRFYLSFFSFLIWNLLSTWWIGYVSVTGMLLIVAINSLVMASVWWLKHPVKRKLGELSGIFSLILFWLTFEFFQHIWELRWPWLTLGNGFANSVKTIQWYEFTGVLGGSLWILIANFLIYFSIKQIFRGDWRKSLIYSGISLSLIVIPISYSVIRYSDFQDKGSILKVLILQPNLDPYTQKFSGINSKNQVDRLISLADESTDKSTDLILAPETALPDQWEDSVSTEKSDLVALSVLMQKFPNVAFISGAMTRRKVRVNEEISATTRLSDDGMFYYDLYNSALIFEKSKEIRFNHKSILVSGVEKMPFQKYFSFLSNFLLRIGGVSGSLSEGSATVFELESKKGCVGSVICFESVFGDHVGELVKKGADCLVVITNDGWWRQSAGVWQHLGYSRLRAIETRRDVARSANTGISAIINKRGDVVEETKINAETSFSVMLKLNDELTFYTKYGDWLGRISLLLSGLVILFYFFRS